MTATQELVVPRSIPMISLPDEKALEADWNWLPVLKRHGCRRAVNWHNFLVARDSIEDTVS
jgi:hypothetical protein